MVSVNTLKAERSPACGLVSSQGVAVRSVTVDGEAPSGNRDGQELVVSAA